MRIPPDNFQEYQGEEIMSNFDHSIVQSTVDAIKGKPFFSRYPGWGFNGKVWWQDGYWYCAVWVYGSHQRTFYAETLEGIMSSCCNEYGAD